MVRSFDNEQICKKFLTLTFGRSLMIDISNQNKVKTLTEKLERLVMKSPEEETCLDIIEKYKLYRETIVKIFMT